MLGYNLATVFVHAEFRVQKEVVQSLFFVYQL